MMLGMIACFLAGWAIGSFALYSYLILSARAEVLRESEFEEDAGGIGIAA